MEDIDKVLAFEIKKDIADRYFGFRKMIEQDKSAYLESVLDSSFALEAGIGLDFVRLYILLKEASLIRQFQKAVGVPPTLFYDPYICTSVTICQNVLKDQEIRGLTKRMRYRNLFCDIYRRLQQATIKYNATLAELDEQYESIREQINTFYRRNDLDTILSFIRSLDHSANEISMRDNLPAHHGDNSLEKKLEIDLPQPVTELLPDIPVLPPFRDIKRQLLNLVHAAILHHPGFDVRICR